MRKIKVLFFSADPSRARPDGVPLELAEEMREIQYHVRQARYGHRLRLEAHGAARADDLIDFLESTDARVVHFSGHGGREGLVLVAPDGRSRHPVNAAALGAMFREYHGPVRLVVLSACSSHDEAQAIADIVGCAIGTSSEISDTAAIKFNSRFYRAIANGDSVQQAFDRACMALKVHRVPEHEHPKLFLRKGVDPADLVLVKTTRLVPRRMAAAGAACVLTAGIVINPFRPPTPPELTASDVACGTPSQTDGIRPLADDLPRATAATPAEPPGPAADLADAKAFYRARNYAAAVPVFERAATAGNGEAMGCLGVIYMYGRGVKPQTAIGFEWVHNAATKKRDPHAMYALGIAYLNGYGGDRLEYLAEDWFEKAAAQGFVEAMRSLGSLYQARMNDSSYQQALSWYGKAIKAGSVDARVDVGLMYELGLGVSRDHATAFQWYRYAAQARSPRGMFAVGQSYEKGVGVPKDYAKAMAWFRKAAKVGSAEAMNSIGVLYDNGRGVRRSRRNAIRWYERAAQAGSPLARGNLAALGRD